MTIPQSPADIRALVPESYHTGHKLRNLNFPASVVSAHDLKLKGTLLMRFAAPGLTKAEHAERAAHFRQLSNALEQEWAVEVEAACQETFGRSYEFTDYVISGIARDEFSADRKERLRALAHTKGDCADAALAHDNAHRRTREHSATTALAR